MEADPAPPPPTPPTKPRRWLRVVAWTAAGLLAFVLLLVALLPTILSSGWARDRAVEAASESAGRWIGLAGLDVGWGSAGLADLSVHAGSTPDSPVLLRVREVRIPAGITAAFASRYDLAPVEILEPVVRIDLRGPGSAPDSGAGASPRGKSQGAADASEPAKPVPPFRVEVLVKDGTLMVVDESGKEARLGTFSARLEASDAGPAKLLVEADLGAAGKVRVESEATPFRAGVPLPPLEVAGTMKVVLEALDIAALQAALAAAPGPKLEEARGILSATLEARCVEGTGALDGDLSLEAKNLVLAGPAVGGRIEEPSVSLSAGFRAARDGPVDVRDGTLRIDGLAARGGGGRGPDGSIAGAISAEGRLGAIAERAKRLGLLPEGTAVAGEFSLEARAAGDLKAHRVTGSLTLKDAQISPGGGKAPLDEPLVRASFDVTGSGHGGLIHEATLQSGSVVARASGSWDHDGNADLKASATIQVARAARIATGLGAALPGDLSGTAEIEASLRSSATPGPEDGAKASIVLRDLVILPPGKGAEPVRDPRVEVLLDAVPGKESWTLRSLAVKGVGVGLRAAGSAAKDGASGTLETLDADLDLARADAIGRAFGASPAARASGAASWRGPVSWEMSGDRLSVRGEASLKDLAVLFPAEGGRPERVLREGPVSAKVDLSVEGREGARATTIRSMRVEADGLRLDAKATLAADGGLEADAAGSVVLAECTRRLAALGALEKDPALRGSVEFDVGLRGKPGEGALALRRLEAKDADFVLSGKGSASRKGAADIEIAFDADLATLAETAARAGSDAIPKGAAGKVSARVTAKAATPEAPVDAVVAASVEGLSWPDPAGAPPWTQRKIAFDGKAVFDRAAEKASIEGNLSADDGTAKVDGRAVLTEGKKAFDGKAVLDFDLGGFLRSRPDLLPIEGMSMGRAKGTVVLRGPMEGPIDTAALEGALRLLVDEVATEPITLKAAEVDAGLKGGVVDLRSITATVNGGAVTAKGSLGIAGAAPRHAIEAKATGVKIDPAMTYLLKRVVPLFAVGEAAGVSGFLEASLALEAEGVDWTRAKPTLRGKGHLAVSEGTIGGSGILGEIAELLGGGRTFGFSAIRTEFAVRDQAVWNDRITVDGKEHALLLRGSTGFDGKLDYKVGARALKIGKKRMERIKPLLDEDGNLPFTLGGTLGKPKLKPPDLKKVAGNVLEDALKKKLKDLLGGDD